MNRNGCEITHPTEGLKTFSETKQTTANSMGLIFSFLSNSLPTSLWKGNFLYLPLPLAKAHRDFLTRNSWFSEYNPASAGGVGGDAPEEAREHVINRFLNSAARMQYVCCDPLDEQPEVRQMVLDQLADGHIYLLDIAAGNGAGTLAILSMIADLRENDSLPTFPVNLNITGVDYSPEALNYYAELLAEIDPWLKSKGIVVDLTLSVCDLTISGDFSEALEIFIDDAKASKVKRFLCVISALSGAKKEGLNAMHDSLKIAAAGLSSKKRNTSWLWVEPHVGKSWITKAIDSVRLTLQKVAHKFFPKGDSYDIHVSPDVPLLEEPMKRSFKWHDPHLEKVASSHVFVMAFKNE